MTGAADLPGHACQDRSAEERGGDVYLARDQVAAPGLLSEVSFTSAMIALRLAVGTQQRRRQPAHETRCHPPLGTVGG